MCASIFSKLAVQVHIVLKTSSTADLPTFSWSQWVATPKEFTTPA